MSALISNVCCVLLEWWVVALLLNASPNPTSTPAPAQTRHRTYTYASSYTPTASIGTPTWQASASVQPLSVTVQLPVDGASGASCADASTRLQGGNTQLECPPDGDPCACSCTATSSQLQLECQPPVLPAGDYALTVVVNNAGSSLPVALDASGSLTNVRAFS